MAPLITVSLTDEEKAAGTPASGSGGFKLQVNAAADRCGDVDQRIQ